MRRIAAICCLVLGLTAAPCLAHQDKLAGGDWVLPSGYSVADPALFFVTFWAVKRMNMPVPARIEAQYRRMLQRPAVQRALATEGLEG